VLPFLHDRLQRREQLLVHSSAVLGKYNRRDFDLTNAVNTFLDDAVAVHRTLQLTAVENAFLALKAQFVSAEQGTHPDTLEHRTGQRRDLVRAIALRVLQRSAEQLRDDGARDEQLLQDARRQLQPLVLLAVRDALVPQSSSKRLNQQQVHLLWLALVQAPESALAARQLAMQTSLYDVLLLLGDLVEAVTRLASARLHDESVPSPAPEEASES
jgi:hypothetical protein